MRRAAVVAVGVAVVCAAGASPVPAANQVVGNDAPTWSPDGARIAFTSFRNGRGDIYAMNADGTHQVRLTTNEGHDDLPAWSPDGTRIAFVSDRVERQPDIWVMNADGTGQRRVTTDLAGDYAPSWSPDGSRIAFWSNRDGNTNIYSIGADGTDEQRLTENRADDTAPKWGPDGRILWVSTRGTGTKNSIYVMNGDGTDQHRLTTPAFFWNETQPSWSPDGSRIVFVADRDFPVGNTEIYTIGADTTGLRRLTTYPAKDGFPAWSPDGQRIAFARGRSTIASEIYVLNVDSLGVRQLTLPRIDLVDYALLPNRPRAGSEFSAVMLVAEASGADIGSPTLACSARIGTTRLRAFVVFALLDGRATCTWRLPRSARGKRVTGSMVVRAPINNVTKTFSFRVG